jgi:hypothetical protein
MTPTSSKADELLAKQVQVVADGMCDACVLMFVRVVLSSCIHVLPHCQPFRPVFVKESDLISAADHEKRYSSRNSARAPRGNGQLANHGRWRVGCVR